MEERLALVERVAASGQFRRSARLREFVLYVGRQSLREGCAEIHEQEIGVKVFGRSPNYDRSQDNIVRVNASELRKRIESYFASEGASEPIVIEIPRGGYRATFRRRTPEGTAPRPDAADRGHLLAATIGPNATGRIGRLPWGTVFGVTAAVLGVVCLVLSVRLRTLSQSATGFGGRTANSTFWAGFVRPGQSVDLVLADASVSLSEDIAGRPLQLEDYLDHRYVPQGSGPTGLSPDRLNDLQEVFHHNLVAFGDVRAAEQIVTASGRPSSFHLTFARLFTPDSLKQRSAVLIGGKKANPWVQLFDREMNFSLDFDSQSYVANRDPRPGERARYYPTTHINGLLGYSVIAYLPNLSHTGDVLIMAGTDSDATTAAAEFLTSKDGLERLRGLLGGGERLPYFEVLLKTSRLSGTSLDSTLLAYRSHGSAR